MSDTANPDRWADDPALIEHVQRHLDEFFTGWPDQRQGVSPADRMLLWAATRNLAVTAVAATEEYLRQHAPAAPGDDDGGVQPADDEATAAAKWLAEASGSPRYDRQALGWRVLLANEGDVEFAAAAALRAQGGTALAPAEFAADVRQARQVLLARIRQPDTGP